MRKIILLLLLFPICLLSQETYRHYDTQRYFHEHLAKTGSGTEMETYFQTLYEKEQHEKQIHDRSRSTEISAKELGLIFHVVGKEDSKEIELLITEQINILNKAFTEAPLIRSHPSDPDGRYAKLATAPNISFILADIETEQKGIHYAERSPELEVSQFDAVKDPEFGGISSIDPERYINIWITDLTGQKLKSYATSPYHRDRYSGIVLDRALLPTSDRESKNKGGAHLIHLMGNYLGLYDLWDDYEPCRDDYVSDTPRHNAFNYGQPTPGHITTCPSEDNALEMTMNYMDSTDDDFPKMFTAGQVKRMHAVIEQFGPSYNINK